MGAKTREALFLARDTQQRDPVASLPRLAQPIRVHPPAPSPEHLINHRQRLDALRHHLQSLLAGKSRVTLEIGSGHGHFLAAYATEYPDRFCVGIDIMLDRLNRSERKRERANLSNLVFVRASAADFLEVMPAQLRLDDILILFPDPWPKRRHHKNRLIQASFLTSLARAAHPGARLCFRTDHDDYFTAAAKVISSHPNWQIDSSAPWPFELTTVFQARAPKYQSLVAVLRTGV